MPHRRRRDDLGKTKRVFGHWVYMDDNFSFFRPISCEGEKERKIVEE
jgi:hypothetical protein